MSRKKTKKKKKKTPTKPTGNQENKEKHRGKRRTKIKAMKNRTTVAIVSLFRNLKKIHKQEEVSGKTKKNTCTVLDLFPRQHVRMLCSIFRIKRTDASWNLWTHFLRVFQAG